MGIRTTQSRVTFANPFTLPELDGAQPAGTYLVETDEEIIQGNERTAYIRVATLLHVESAGKTRVITIDPEGLKAALSTCASQG